jgi:hypothetical protein
MLYERSNFESEKFRGYTEAEINQISKVMFFIIKPKIKKEKIKQSHYRPGEALRVPKG